MEQCLVKLFTAARSGELVVMRAIEIDMSGGIWTYSPKDHKTAHHGYERTIYIGPRAQKVVLPFLEGRGVNNFLFSPKNADAERRAIMHKNRKTPLSCGNRPGTNKKHNPQKS